MQSRRRAAGESCTIPFGFTVPRHCPLDEILNEQLLRLPPSLRAGQIIIGHDGRKYMQPLIEYVIRAVVKFRHAASGSPMQLEASREILMIPLAEASPPLEIGDFPGEFNPVATTPFRKRLSTFTMGEMSISMNEPPPLTVFGNRQRAFSRCWVNITLRQAGTIKPHVVAPESLVCSVESRICVKTFYSTVPLSEMASDCLLRTQRELGLRTETVKLNTSKIDLRSWRLDRLYECESSSPCQASQWSTTLLLPIETSEDLRPTFCCPLAARRYGLEVRLRVKGLRHHRLAVRVPLQVGYRRLDQIQARRAPPAVESESDMGDT